MESSYLIIASNASTDIYPNNTLVHFKNELPHEIDTTDFKIALQSISLDNKYGTVPNYILGTENHFLLLAQEDSDPIATYNVTDFTLSSGTFAKEINNFFKPFHPLGTHENDLKVLVKVIQKKIVIIVNHGILLVSKNMNRWLAFEGDNISYGGDEYTALMAIMSKKHFVSKNNFPTTTLRGPKILKVQLSEMQQSVSQVTYVQDLATIYTHTSKANYPMYNVCKRKEYFDLNTNRLTKLQIRLVDEENYPLHLGSGQPTFIKLQLKKFPMETFVLRLSSLESSEIYTDNTSSSFRIQLQQPIDIQRSWEVALSSIFLPSVIDLGHFLTSEKFYIEISTNNGTDYTSLELNKLKKYTQSDLVVHVKDSLSQKYGDDSEPFTIFEEGSNIIVVQTIPNVKIRVSGLLTYILGKAATPDVKEYFDVNTTLGVRQLMGRANFKKLYPHVVLVYCNFIVPIVVGNSFGQVIQIIPYFNEDAEEIGVFKYEAEHLDFHPLAMNNKMLLQFEMRSSTGELIPFAEKNAEILINLVFREKK